MKIPCRSEVSESHSVVSDSLQPHGLSMEFSRPEYWSGIVPTEELNSGLPHHRQTDSLPAEPPGKPKNTGVGSLSLLQGIFLTQESNWGLLHCRWILYQLSYEGSPFHVEERWYYQAEVIHPSVQKLTLGRLWGAGDVAEETATCWREHGPQRRKGCCVERSEGSDQCASSVYTFYLKLALGSQVGVPPSLVQGCPLHSATNPETLWITCTRYYWPRWGWWQGVSAQKASNTGQLMQAPFPGKAVVSFWVTFGGNILNV